MAAAANAGRTPRPVALKLIEGRGPGRDSGGREVKQPPGFTRLPPTKPEGMTEVAARLWDQLVPELQRLQLTKPIDGPALEQLCEAYSRWHAAREMRRNGGAVKGLLGKNSQGVVTAPWIGIEERASKEYRAWCSEFGLTPAAEANVGAREDPNGDGPNPFAD